MVAGCWSDLRKGQNPGMQALLAAEKDKETDSSLQPPEETSPADTLTLAQ